MEDEIIIEELEDEEIVIEETDSNDGIEVVNESIVNIGTKNYKELDNKPSIEGVVLINDRSLDELGIQEKGDYANSRITNMELEEIFRN